MSDLRGRPQKEGLLELVFLNECSAMPYSGKEVMEKVALETNGEWKPSAGSVYPLLKSLEKSGLLTAGLGGRELGRREIKYKTTKAGLRVLEEKRKSLEARFEKFFTCMMPLCTKITHGLTDEEVEDMKEDTAVIGEFRKMMMHSPKPVRKRIMREISAVFREKLASLKPKAEGSKQRDSK